MAPPGYTVSGKTYAFLLRFNGADDPAMSCICHASSHCPVLAVHADAAIENADNR